MGEEKFETTIETNKIDSNMVCVCVGGGGVGKSSSNRGMLKRELEMRKKDLTKEGDGLMDLDVWYLLNL